MESEQLNLLDNSAEDRIQRDLQKAFESKRSRIFSSIVSAALGAIPWVGGLLSAIADFRSEEGKVKNNQLYKQWLEEHRRKMTMLSQTLVEVVGRLNEFSDDINQRLESEEYLDIVRKSFRSWDNAETVEKRDLIRKLLTNSGAQTLVPDDLIRLFLDWINLYHEIHFSVIGEIYKRPGITRHEIWQQLNGKAVREDSLEADLFKLLIRDLSTGSVIRQHREVDYSGNFVKNKSKKVSYPSGAYKSAFDDQEGYELTELGKQFVHYTMNEVVPRIK
jgi:hypothetical protein